MGTTLIIKGADFSNNCLPKEVEIDNLVAGLLTSGGIGESSTRLACTDYFEYGENINLNINIELYKWNIIFYNSEKKSIDSSYPPLWIEDSNSINDALLLPDSNPVYFRIGFGRKDDTQLTVEEGTGKFSLLY